MKNDCESLTTISKGYGYCTKHNHRVYFEEGRQEDLILCNHCFQYIEIRIQYNNYNPFTIDLREGEPIWVDRSNHVIASSFFSDLFNLIPEKMALATLEIDVEFKTNDEKIKSINFSKNGISIKNENASKKLTYPTGFCLTSIESRDKISKWVSFYGNDLIKIKNNNKKSATEKIEEHKAKEEKMDSTKTPTILEHPENESIKENTKEIVKPIIKTVQKKQMVVNKNKAKPQEKKKTKGLIDFM